MVANADLDEIAFLGLIVALSAYIATLRLRLIDKMREASSAGETTRRKKLGWIAIGLTLADAPLVLAAAFLFFHGFWESTIGQITGNGAPGWLQPWSIYLFTFAGLVLILHHMAAWCKSVFG